MPKLHPASAQLRPLAPSLDLLKEGVVKIPGWAGQEDRILPDVVSFEATVQAADTCDRS